MTTQPNSPANAPESVPPATAEHRAAPGDPPEIEYAQLAGEAPYVVVVHEGLRYQLRSTKNGRLILNR